MKKDKQQQEESTKNWVSPVLIKLNVNDTEAADFANPFDGDGGPGPS